MKTKKKIKGMKMLLNQKHSTAFPKELQPDVKNETFLLKLFQILQTKKYNPFIHWSEDGKSIIISNITELTKKVLPKFFKHRNYASFVRQLNMYNFHKVRNNQNQNEQVFNHENFTKNQDAANILKIKRKIKFEMDLEKNSLVKDDIQIINSYIDAINHKTISKQNIEQMMVFLFKKVKENIEEQGSLKKQVETLSKQNEVLLNILSKNAEQFCDNNALLNKFRIALLIMTRVIKTDSEDKQQNQFKAFIYKYLQKHNSTNNQPSGVLNPAEQRNTIETNETFSINNSYETHKGTDFLDEFSTQNLNTSSNNLFDLDLGLEKNNSFRSLRSFKSNGFLG